VLHLEPYADYLTDTYAHDRLPGGARDVFGWRDLSPLENRIQQR